jgi:short subunit dehydrogenase-like uncharacterized protein
MKPQGVIRVPCQQCRKRHYIVISSSEQSVVEQTVEHLVSSLRRGGANPSAAAILSAPGYELHADDTDEIDRFLDEVAVYHPYHE